MQHDYDLANAAGAAFRADANSALLAIVSNNSAATAPATTFAYMWWADTTTGILKQRNAANNAWINILTLSTGGVAAATNITGGSAGTILYQSATDTTAMLAAGSAGQLIVSGAAPSLVAAGTAGQILTSAGASSPTWTTARQLAQIQRSFNGTFASGTTVIPFDNTIPQNTEGDQYYSVSITPVNASSLLEIDVILNLTNSSIGQLMVALFKDAVADALSVGYGNNVSGTSQPIQLNLKYYVAAGSISATTFKIRAGSSAAGTTSVNGASGAGLFGGTLISGISVKEWLP